MVRELTTWMEKTISFGLILRSSSRFGSFYYKIVKARHASQNGMFLPHHPTLALRTITAAAISIPKPPKRLASKPRFIVWSQRGTKSTPTSSNTIPTNSSIDDTPVCSSRLPSTCTTMNCRIWKSCTCLWNCWIRSFRMFVNWILYSILIKCIVYWMNSCWLGRLKKQVREKFWIVWSCWRKWNRSNREMK